MEFDCEVPKEIWKLKLEDRIKAINTLSQTRYKYRKAYQRLILGRMTNRTIVCDANPELINPEVDLQKVSELVSKYYDVAEDKKLIITDRKIKAKQEEIMLKIRDKMKCKVYECAMFGVSDYLGYINDYVDIIDVLKKYRKSMAKFGGANSYNYTGNNYLSEAVKKGIAYITGQEAAIQVSSGYQANEAWVVGLLSPQDVLIIDRNVHSSISSVTVPCARIQFKHMDVEDLELKLKEVSSKIAKNSTILVGVDGVDSSTGEISPLDKISELCEKYNAKLIVDDAHAIGIIGKNGGGTPSHFNIIDKVFLHVGSFNKSAGAKGGFVAGKKDLITYMSFVCGPSSFTSSPTDYERVGILEAIKLIIKSDDRRKKLNDNIKYLQEELTKRNIKFFGDKLSGVFAVPVKSIYDAVTGSLDMGVFVNPSEYPAIERGKSRIRGFMSANHTKEDIDQLVKAIEKYYDDKQ